jgi:hypothetical protein
MEKIAMIAITICQWIHHRRRRKWLHQKQMGEGRSGFLIKVKLLAVEDIKLSLCFYFQMALNKGTKTTPWGLGRIPSLINYAEKVDVHPSEKDKGH